MATKNGWWAAILVIGMAVGCGDNGGGGSVGGPNPTEKASTQKAATAANSMTTTQDAANDAIVESGAPGSTSAKTGSSKSSTAGTLINFQATVTVVVDLDAKNSSNQDMFPNAEGQFEVNANGSITGDGMAGQASYDVHVKWLTDGHFTDPVCGDTATVAKDSNWNYSLLVQWAKVDDLNWSITASADVNGTLNATVTHGTDTWTVNGSVTRHAALSFTRTAGNYAFTWSINGTWTVVVAKGAETHTVVATMSALDHIVIDIDGVVFGPFTAAQIWWWFAVQWHC